MIPRLLTATLVVLIAGCSLPDASTGTPTVAGQGRASEANDPIARGYVSDEAVRQGHQLFRTVMNAEGMIGVRTAMQKCQRPDPRPDPRTPNLPADLCLAFDRAQWILGVAMERQRGIRMLPGLGTEDVQRREANALRVLRVPPAQHRLVSDSVFQRVFALGTRGG